MSGPKFSVIITCYNLSAFIQEAVDSALAQGYSHREIIVVDDGSTDRSRELLGHYGKAINFLAQETNSGVEAARNRGVSVATGDFLVFLDGDDVLLDGALEAYARVIAAKKPKLLLAGLMPFEGPFAELDLRGVKRGIRLVNYRAYLERDRWFRISASALIIERGAFFEAGQWLTGTFPWDDVDLTLRLGHMGPTVQITSPQTVAYRLHGANVSHKILRQIQAAAQIVLKEKSGQYPDRQFRFARRMRIGNTVFPLLKRSYQNHLAREGWKLLAVSWPLLIQAALGRLFKPFKAARPEETL